MMHDHLVKSANLNKLIQRVGYNLEQKNGQRIYTVNDPIPPPKGCEIYFGKIPRDMFEDTLVPIFERIGKIYQMRLMMDFNGLNRGFGFVTYYKQGDANTAVLVLNGYEARPGNKMGVFKSVDNCRLFVGGLPPEKSKLEVYEGLSQYVEGIKDIIMYFTYGNKNLNRGFVFVEFFEHRLAAMARRRLCPGSLVLWGVPIFVEWAEPIPEVDSKVLSKVKKLYLRNLAIELTNDDLLNIIEKYVPSASILKVHKMLDYAFVHLSCRKSAEEAMDAMQGMIVNGEIVEVTWARPMSYSKSAITKYPPQHFCISVPPRSRKEIKMRSSKPNINFNKIVDSNSLSLPSHTLNSPSTSSGDSNVNLNITPPTPFNLFPNYLNEIINYNANHLMPKLQLQQGFRFAEADPFYFNPIHFGGLNDFTYSRLY